MLRLIFQITWLRTDMTAPQISSPTMNCSPSIARIKFSQQRDAKPFFSRIIHLPPDRFASSCCTKIQIYHTECRTYRPISRQLFVTNVSTIHRQQVLYTGWVHYNKIEIRHILKHTTKLCSWKCEFMSPIGTQKQYISCNCITTAENINCHTSHIGRIPSLKRW